MFPVRPNDRDRDRERDRKSTTSSRSSRTKDRKDRDRNRDRDRTTDKDRHRPRNSTKDRDRRIAAHSSSTTSTPTSHSSRRRRSSMPGVDSASRAGTASFLESRVSLPYPSFSKAHSKECVAKPNIPTPDPTDLTESGKERPDSPGKDGVNGAGNRTDNHHAPPSPPLTSMDQQSSRKGSPDGEKDKKAGDGKPKEKTKIRIRAESTRSSSSLRAKKDDGSKSSSKSPRPDTPTKTRLQSERDTPSRTSSHKTSKAKVVDEVKLPKRSASHATMSPSRSSVNLRDVGSESTVDSDATSIAPNQHQTYQKPLTPPQKPPSRNQTRSSTSHRYSQGERSPVDVTFDQRRPPSTNLGYGAPPPPPPPPEMPVTTPRVDYLLRNGGLHDRIPKTLLAAGHLDTSSSQSFQPQVAAGKVFEPFNRLLDDYHKVMNFSGSLAVATGYRSVARRLLDRLEAVFARDISCESCHCLMCDHAEMEERASGVSWGEVLELVSGRRELPGWPPFNIAPCVTDPGLSSEEYIPMQKLDIDVPEEYRDHYIRQSRKTKLAVDKWLSEQNEQTTSPPDEVDDETLTFAMMTHLGPDERPLFCALLGIRPSTPVPKSDAQQPRTRPPALVSSALAIQRLYRLPTLPRDSETAIYMLNNPSIHHVLATLAAISNDEWEILVSGRFDGFLRSGAEDNIPPLSGSRYGSRSTTPFSVGGISRGSTPSMDGSFRSASQPYGSNGPASFGGPIALDEETEIAALAEIERDIYLGMEALEDAFEALHCKAEMVRRALRERGAGLSVANQNRRGSYVEARLGTPSSNLGHWESGTEDDGIDDDRSLAPDDSASNISSNRRRRPKRRTERRTPAPVEEEDEGEERSHVSSSRRDHDKRRSLRR